MNDRSLDSFDDVDDESTEDIEYLYLKAVLSGKVYPRAAKRLLQLLGFAVLRGEAIAAHHRHWLGYALIAVGEGIDPGAALRMKGRRARPLEISWVEAIFFIHPKICKGVAWTTACAEASVEIGEELRRSVDEKTVRALYQRHLAPVYQSIGNDRARAMGVGEFGSFVSAMEQVIVPGYPLAAHQRVTVRVRKKKPD